jgi:hypothetical protein
MGVTALIRTTCNVIIALFFTVWIKFNLNLLKMINFLIQICCLYIMKTCGMIWNVFNKKKNSKLLIKHYNLCLINIVSSPILEELFS